MSEYTPAQDKRFQVSEDSESIKRVKSLHSLYNYLVKGIPNCHFGISLFGSLSKGRPLNGDQASESDVDVICYYDPESSEDPVHVVHKIQSAAEEQLGTQLFGKSYFDIRRIGHTGKYSILDVCIETYYQGMQDDLEPDSPYGKPSEQRIAGFFHLDIGGGLKSYIISFIKQLQELAEKDPSRASSYWDHIRYCVERTERGNIIPPQMKGRFPQTIEQAIAYYL